MLPSLGAPTECEVDDVNSSGVNNGEGSSTALGVRAWIGGVMAKLEGVTCLPKRGVLEKRPVPFLCLLMYQNRARQPM